MYADVKWRSFIIFIVGLAARFVATIAATFVDWRKEFFLTMKERLYLGIAWSAKAAGQGLLAHSIIVAIETLSITAEASLHINQLSTTALIAILIG